MGEYIDVFFYIGVCLTIMGEINRYVFLRFLCFVFFARPWFFASLGDFFLFSSGALYVIARKHEKIWKTGEKGFCLFIS